MKKILLIMAMILFSSKCFAQEERYYILRDVFEGKSVIATEINWGSRTKVQWVERDVDVHSYGLLVTNITDGPFGIKTKSVSVITYLDMINAATKAKLQIQDRVVSKFLNVFSRKKGD